MSRKIWTFGDSFTQSLFNNDTIWIKRYTDWKGYTPKVYGELIAEDLKLELINLGKGGLDNYGILQSVCDNSNRIHRDDIVLIGWSSHLRFRIVNDSNNWQSIVPNVDINEMNLQHISEITINEMLINRNSSLYINEIQSWIKLLDCTFRNNILIHWSPWGNGIAPNYFKNIETIEMETDGSIYDNHYSEKGHTDLANEFIYMINKNLNKKLI